MAARIRVNGCAHTALTAGELQRDEHPVCLSENEGLYASFFLDNKRHMVGRFFITCSGRLLDSCCYDQKQHAHYLHDVCIQIMCNNAFINLVLTGAVGTVYVGDYIGATFAALTSVWYSAVLSLFISYQHNFYNGV